MLVCVVAQSQVELLTRVEGVFGSIPGPAMFSMNSYAYSSFPITFGAVTCPWN